MDILVVVDMQKDFVDGALGSPEAQAIVPTVVDKVKNFTGEIIFTRDTHQPNYMETAEGKKLPVPHCIQDTAGWEIIPQLETLRTTPAVDKVTFGGTGLAERVVALHETQGIDSITLVGLCTDICVISNAMLLKAHLPEVPIAVEAACCAGVTPQTHLNALEAMKMCQIDII